MYAWNKKSTCLYLRMESKEYMSICTYGIKRVHVYIYAWNKKEKALRLQVRSYMKYEPHISSII